MAKKTSTKKETNATAETVTQPVAQSVPEPIVPEVAEDTNTESVKENESSEDNTELLFNKLINQFQEITSLMKTLQSNLNILKKEVLRERKEDKKKIEKTKAKKSNKGEFLFVSYNELVTQTKETIEKIYTFCEWDSFEHNYNEIINKHPEDDTVYKLNGMHDIRSTISKRNLNTQLTPAMLKRCKELDIY